MLDLKPGTAVWAGPICPLSWSLGLVVQPLLSHWPQRRVFRKPRVGRLGILGLTSAWCAQGSFRELVYVFYMVKDAGLAPDLLSYAAALQCMGRLDQGAHTVKR